jgi:hypothetical protein
MKKPLILAILVASGCSTHSSKKNSDDSEQNTNSETPNVVLDNDDTSASGSTTNYNFRNEDHFYVLSPIEGLSFNEFWGLFVNKPKYCENSEERESCMSKTIAEGLCLVSTKPIDFPGSGEITSKIDFSVTALENSIPLIKEKPVFSLNLTADVENENIKLADSVVHLSDLPFRYEGETHEGKNQMFLSTTGFDSRTLVKKIDNIHGAKNITVSFCNNSAFNINIKNIKITTVSQSN